MEIVEHHIMVEGVRMKVCPECGDKYPLNEKRCWACGYDEDCACCILRYRKEEA